MAPLLAMLGAERPPADLVVRVGEASGRAAQVPDQSA